LTTLHSTPLPCILQQTSSRTRQIVTEALVAPIRSASNRIDSLTSFQDLSFSLLHTYCPNNYFLHFSLLPWYRTYRRSGGMIFILHEPDPSSLAAPDFNIYPFGYLSTFLFASPCLSHFFSLPRWIDRPSRPFFSSQSLRKNNAHCHDSRLSSQNTLGARGLADTVGARVVSYRVSRLASYRRSNNFGWLVSHFTLALVEGEEKMWKC